MKKVLLAFAVFSFLGLSACGHMGMHSDGAGCAHDKKCADCKDHKEGDKAGCADCKK